VDDRVSVEVIDPQVAITIGKGDIFPEGTDGEIGAFVGTAWIG